MNSVLNTFYFKHFSLIIDKNVFPVTTDSVLLGSWTEVDNAKTVMDIGCGCGILSLMLAQKSNRDTKIYAVDIDKASIQCSHANIENSPWTEKIVCEQIDLNHFFSKNSFAYLKSSIDLIVSNPPYFDNQLVSKETHTAISKHQHGFDFNLLSKLSDHFVNDSGKSCFVIPYKYQEELTYQMYLNSFQLNRVTRIKHTAHSLFSLVLLEYRRKLDQFQQDEIILFQKDGQRTKEFNELTKDYYDR